MNRLGLIIVLCYLLFVASDAIASSAQTEDESHEIFGFKTDAISIKNIKNAKVLDYLNPFSSQQSDEDRILEDIDSASVHLTTGLKIIATNPNNDAEISEVRQSFKQLIDSANTAGTKTTGLSMSELSQLATIGYKAKQLGAAEVALLKKSNFRFVNHVITDVLPDTQWDLTVQQDHALTLAAFFALKIYPIAPVPVSQKALLYEAWMAADAEFGNDTLDATIDALQAITYAQNEYCHFAQQETEMLRQRRLTKVNTENLKFNLADLEGFGPAAAHVPAFTALIGAIAILPAAIELYPGIMRIVAHTETARCLEARGDSELAYKQLEYAVDVMVTMGVPDTELALFKALLAYKNNDTRATREYLAHAQNSRFLDARSKKDLLTLANTIDNPDAALIRQYFSTTYLAFITLKIVNQRLIDEGVYTRFLRTDYVPGFQKVYTGLMTSNTDDAVNKGKEWWSNITDQ